MRPSDFWRWPVNTSPKTELQQNAERALALKQAAGTQESLNEHPSRGQPTDPLLFPPEVRALVRLSEPTVYRLRRKGKFPPPILLGERRIAWRQSSILAWLASRENAS